MDGPEPTHNPWVVGSSPTRPTWATTGCVVVSGVSWTSAAVRNSCATRSPRSTDMRNPASRIKAVAVAHRCDVDRTCLVFPGAEQIRQSSVPSGFGGEQAKSDAKCVRPAAMDLGQLVERVLFIGVPRRPRHVAVQRVVVRSAKRVLCGTELRNGNREGGGRDIGLRTASDDEIIDDAISADRIVISHDADLEGCWRPATRASRRSS